MVRPLRLALQSIELPRFRGVNLVDQPTGLADGELLDGRNIEATDTGGIRRRSGVVRLGGPATLTGSRFVRSFLIAGTQKLVVGRDGGLGQVVMDENGTNLVTNVTTAAIASAASIGGPNSPRAYFGTGGDTVRRYDATNVITAPTCTLKDLIAATQTTGNAMPKGALVCAWPGEERLLVGGFSSVGGEGPGGLASGPEYVWISEPGDPEAFARTSFVRLLPGDGETMTGIVAWRDMVFVFKETRYFVFRQVSTDARGVATYYRQAVDVGIGCVGRNAVCVGRDGVYFVSRRGIMRTRGGDPQLVAPKLRPLFDGLVAPYYTGGGPIALNASALAIANGRLYWGYQSDLPNVTPSNPDRTWVIDLERGEQAYPWDVGMVSAATLRVGAYEQPVLLPLVGVYPHRIERTAVLDVIGNNVNPLGYSSWLLGAFFAPHDGHVCRVRQVGIFGEGQVDVGLACDFDRGGPLVPLKLGARDTWGDGTGTDTWGDGTGTDLWSGGGPVRPQLARRSYKAAYFALRLESREIAGQPQRTPWTVSRAVLQLPNGGVKPASTLSA